LLLALPGICVAQNQPPAFEVVSVRRASTNRFVPAAVNPQRFKIVATLSGAILWAYDIRNYQLTDGPLWVRRDYYQIEGRPQAPATIREMRLMLQTLLADRFKLKVHREAREMPIYALTIGQSGPRLQSTNGTCGANGCIDVGPGELIAKYATMFSTAATLSNLVDRPVLDQTGLEGRYDFQVKFDPTLIKPYDGQPAPSPGIDSPSIFSALQQLGLKLEPRRAASRFLSSTALSNLLRTK